MGVESADSALNGIQMALFLANETEDRSSTNLTTVTTTLQIIAENESIAVDGEVLIGATNILSLIQNWGMDDSTLGVLQNSSAEYVFVINILS